MLDLSGRHPPGGIELRPNTASDGESSPWARGPPVPRGNHAAQPGSCGTGAGGPPRSDSRVEPVRLSVKTLHGDDGRPLDLAPKEIRGKSKADVRNES
jgi:hypothetical protein